MEETNDKLSISEQMARPIRAMLRGSGQVMFQNNAITGALFLIGIFYGAYSAGTPSVAYGALVGLAVSTVTGCILNRDKSDGDAGLWGFNGILVGCAFPTFLSPVPLMWVALVICSMLSVWVRTGMNNMLSPLKINSLTFPFVFTSWIFMLSARMLCSMPADALSEPELTTVTTECGNVCQYGALNMLSAMLRSVSQVFLIDSWVTGAIFIIALSISSIRAAVWAVIGAAVSLMLAILYGAPADEIQSGLYGFSAVLTAIALGATFYKVSVRSTIWALLGIVVTLFIQAGMNALMRPFGLPTFTAPFCIATWLFLLPLYKFDSRKPNHSLWHKEN
jgi:urea transporter